MNIYTINDDEFTSSLAFQNFLKENPTSGNLRIRAYSASEAIPIKGLKIEVSTLIGDDKVIFFEGETDSSGLIDRISLPAPQLNTDNMIKPTSTVYDIYANYPPNNVSAIYKVNMYEDICVVQNINIAPLIQIMEVSDGR